MALIKYDKEMRGNYWKIREFSFNIDNKSCGCVLDLYENTEKRLDDDEPIGSANRTWKSDEYFYPEDKESFYAAIMTEWEAEYFPDFEENDYPKIYKKVRQYTKREYFHNINYDIELDSKMYRTNLFIKGELQKVDYFNDEAKTDKVLMVDMNYDRNELGFAQSRTTTRTWLNENGSENKYKKITKKYYDTLAQIQETITRRGNLVDGLKMPILGLMLATIQDHTEEEILNLGRAFIAFHNNSFQSFISDNNRQIVTDISNAADFWLSNVINANGTTIRDYVLNEFLI